MRLISFTMAALILAGCNPAQASNDAPSDTSQTPETVAPTAPASNSTATLVPAQDASAAQNASAAVPKSGDNYWTARKALMAAGYTAVDTNDVEFTVCPEAMEQEREISVYDCPSQVMPLPEVNSCAGTGEANCLIHWRSPDGRFLTINTVDGPQPGVVSSIEWSSTRPPFEENE